MVSRLQVLLALRRVMSASIQKRVTQVLVRPPPRPRPVAASNLQMVEVEEVEVVDLLQMVEVEEVQMVEVVQHHHHHRRAAVTVLADRSCLSSELVRFFH